MEESVERADTPPPTKRTSSEITPSLREKSTQRQSITSRTTLQRTVNQGDDDVVPTIVNSTSYSKIKNKNKNSSTINTTTSPQSTHLTNKSTTSTLQSSIKSFFNNTDDSTAKYLAKEKTHLPSSTIPSSDFAPDPSKTGTKPFELKMKTSKVHEEDEDLDVDTRQSKGRTNNITPAKENHQRRWPLTKGGNIMKQGDSPMPPMQGETLEPEDLQDYVVQNKDGPPSTLNTKIYYNSWKVQLEQQELDHKQQREKEVEESIQFKDHSGWEEDHDSFEIFDDSASSSSSNKKIEDDPSSNGDSSSSYSDSSSNTSENSKVLPPKHKKMREPIEIIDIEEDDEISEMNKPVATKLVVELDEENYETVKSNRTLNATTDMEIDEIVGKRNSDEEEEESVKTEKMGTLWGKSGPPPAHDSVYKTAPMETEEQEDDINTVNSGDTTHDKMSKEEEAREIYPTNTRYQYIFDIESESLTALKDAFSSKPSEVKERTYSDMVRDEIKAALEEMKRVDKESCIISWKEDIKFSKYDIHTDDFPSATADITKFFPGYRANPPNFNNNKNKKRFVPSYIKLRIHHPNVTAEKFESMLSEWAILNSKKFKKTIIQTPNPRTVGWFLYSSSYTDTTYLKKLLREKTGYEWGFRITPITDKDRIIGGKTTEYKNRAKALTAVVDEKNTAIAFRSASELFLSKSQTSRFDSFEDRYPFVEVEKKMGDRNEKEAFSKLVSRQKLHSELLEAQFYPWIDCDIDKKQFHINSNLKVSLRQLVLTIPKHQQRKDAKREALFHGFDFTMNSAEQWFEGSRGPGGAGHIFSYYKSNDGEAQRMIQGLGLYLATHYKRNKEKIARSFSLDHWKASEGWSWNKEDKTFITTESAMLYQNLLNDTNQAMVRASDEKFAEQLEKKEKEKLRVEKQREEMDYLVATKKYNAIRDKDETYLAASKALEKSSLSDMALVIDSKDMQKLKIDEFTKKQFAYDEDSIDIKQLGKGRKTKEKIMDVLACDNISTTSSLTNNSFASDGGNRDDSGENKDDESIASSSSIKSFNEKYLSQLLEEAGKDVEDTEELMKVAQSALQMKLKKAMMQGQSMIQKQIQERKEKEKGKQKKVSANQEESEKSDTILDPGTPVKTNLNAASTFSGAGTSG